MKLRVLFHSYFRDFAGCSEAAFDLPEQSTVDAVREEVERRFPKLAVMRKSTLIAVGVEYQPGDYRLRAGDEISFFPPVQGG